MAESYVYIMTNRSYTLYTGVTNDLERRVHEHKMKLVGGFTARYNITKLVYFETTGDIESAIAREKQIKGWLRRKKVDLIESVNPEWRDLSLDWADCHSEGARLRRTTEESIERPFAEFMLSEANVLSVTRGMRMVTQESAQGDNRTRQ
jgi:putative endonuclease